MHAYVTPLHPEQWKVLDALPQAAALDDVIATLNRIFDAHGIKFRDFSRIDAFGGDPQLFYDEMHMRPTNHSLLLAELLGEVN